MALSKGGKGIVISVVGDLVGTAAAIGVIMYRGEGTSEIPRSLPEAARIGAVPIVAGVAGQIVGTVAAAKGVGAPIVPAIGVQIASNAAGMAGGYVLGPIGVLGGDLAAAYLGGKAWL